VKAWHFSLSTPSWLGFLVFCESVLKQQVIRRIIDAGHSKKGEKRDDEAHDRTREQWLAARLELLEAEKELTRRSDELARRHQELPWVRIEKEYRFETMRREPR
jgi:uncharacterized protein DUF899